jgi:hypothetical protein
MNNNPAIPILTEYVKAQLERLVMLQEYHREIDDPYVKSSLAFLIEDTHEAIARVSSRLRRIGTTPLSQLSEETTEKLLRQSRTRRSLADKLKFIQHGLKYQQEWYATQIKALRQDADSQAILVALAEQNRVRLERWINLMTEMKVSPDA